MLTVTGRIWHVWDIGIFNVFGVSSGVLQIAALYDKLNEAAQFAMNRSRIITQSESNTTSDSEY